MTEILGWIVEILGGDYYDSHSICLIGDPLMLFLYTVSDFSIFSSYLVISVTLWIGRNLKIQGRPLMAMLFAAFILSCGMTHASDVLTLYVGLYRLDIMIRIATAVISSWAAICTVMELANAIRIDRST